MLVPCRVGDLEGMSPVSRSVFSDSDLADAYGSWSQQRFQFIGTRDEGGWEKDYMRGRFRDDEAPSEDHRTRLKLAPFRQA